MNRSFFGQVTDDLAPMPPASRSKRPAEERGLSIIATGTRPGWLDPYAAQEGSAFTPDLRLCHRPSEAPRSGPWGPWPCVLGRSCPVSIAARTATLR